MACQVNSIPKTEFDFYQVALGSDTFECIGPLLSLCFFGEELEKLTAALECVKFTSFLDENYSHTMSQDGKPVYDICYKHWLELSKILLALGGTRDVPSWVELGYALLTQTSAAVEFDYRLIVNYQTSLNRMKSIGTLFKDE